MISIQIQLRIHHTIHIGASAHSDERIDRPIVKMSYIKGEENLKPFIPSNVLKGVLRKTADQIVKPYFAHISILEQQSTTNHTEPRYDPFISLFGAPNIPGKLYFSNGMCFSFEETQGVISSPSIRTQMGINVDRKTLSVKPHALYSYEMADITRVEFELSAPFLTKEEKAFLMGTLNALHFTQIGGKSSIGAGQILDVQLIDNSIANEYKEHLLSIITHSKIDKHFF